MPFNLSDVAFVGRVQPQDLTNAQKLSLSPSTPVGTVVRVSDAYSIPSGTFSGFWYDRHANNAGRPTYYLGRDNSDHFYETYWDGTRWIKTGPDTEYHSEEDAAYPWLVTQWLDGNGDPIDPQPTLTYPAVQTLAAPSSAQGGVAVLGGTQDGVYPITEGGTTNGKTLFNLLGSGTNDNSGFCAAWAVDLSGDYGLTPNAPGFIIRGDGTVLYYSLSDVATPDLATNWKNASDDSPASITVTSVSVGAIAAGVSEGSHPYINAGYSFGSRYSYSRLGTGSPFLVHVSTKWRGSDENSGGGSNDYESDNDGLLPSDAAWTGAGKTFIRNDVAAEANWHIAP